MPRPSHNAYAYAFGDVPGEQWRAATDFPMYEVSNLGRVRSHYFEPPHICRFGCDKDGYPTIAMTNACGRTTRRVHSLVAKAFHGERRNKLHNEVAHLDNDRANCRADNLKWVSKVENRSHRKLHGTECGGEKHPGAKLTEAAVREILKRSATAKVLARAFGVSRYTIYDLWNGHTWRHVTAGPYREAFGDVPRNPFNRGE